MSNREDTTPTAVAPSSWPTRATPLGPDAASRDQRNRILDATTEVVSKRGFDDTSATRVCKAAGVSHPTFRKHFPDVEHAFLAAVEETIAEGARRVGAAVEAAGPEWVDRVSVALATALAMVEERPARARLFFVETLTAGPQGVALYEAAIQRCLPALHAGRRHAVDGDLLPPMLEGTIAAGVAWSIHRKVARGEAASASKVFAPLLETILTPYVGEERAKAAVAEHGS